MKGVVWAVFLFAVGGLAQLAATPAAPQAKNDIGAAGTRIPYSFAATHNGLAARSAARETGERIKGAMGYHGERP